MGLVRFLSRLNEGKYIGKELSMRNSLMLRVIILIIVLTGICLLVQGIPDGGGKNPVPARQKADTPADTRSVAPVEKQPVHSGFPAGTGENRTGTLRLVPEPQTVVSPSRPTADISYSIRKEKKQDYPIMPGVTFEPGEGLNIKTADAADGIQVRREGINIKLSNDPDAASIQINRDHQILWQKKF
ncbi:Hypothetical protein LUCI_2888 [Lucifera butyrica]|uniref:Uncharacterized protein n=1 Tax=Lucifera butyrica TaxID=1351585 RepID=A0A498RBW2_9FIRM|nr:hypothetical protein [Lucifera butyrica]VBB07623.1 Hypothetical protein LUCI_2888 [Lucifera butyrica]